jgi:tRNA(Ile)-lysidine synthase
MLEKVRKTISRYRMLRRGDTVCVATSGGVDSAVLLHVLCSLADELGLKLVVCHLNHGLRGKESERDFNFVKKSAQRLELPFEGKTLGEGETRKGSLQDWARKKRYEFLEEASAKYGARKVALGHTLDDQAETVLMRFIKGSGTTGLSGMASVRGIYIRPLLETTREEIERYAHDKGIKYVIDSTNKSKKYLRNRLRLDLIPLIERDFNSSIKETLARTASVLARDDEFIRAEAERAIAGLIKKRNSNEITLDRKGLMGLNEALAVRVFLKAASIVGSLSGLYTPHVDSFLTLVKAKRPNATANLPGGLYLKRVYDDITLSTKGLDEPLPFDTELAVPGLTRVDGTGLRLRVSVLKKRPVRLEKTGTAYFDYDALLKPLRVRSFRAGDRMRPMGMEGHKKLKDIFIYARVPRAERLNIPLVESGGKLIWAVGLRQAEEFKVTRSTKRILKITLL